MLTCRGIWSKEENVGQHWQGALLPSKGPEFCPEGTGEPWKVRKKGRAGLCFNRSSKVNWRDQDWIPGRRLRQASGKGLGLGQGPWRGRETKD